MWKFEKIIPPFPERNPREAEFFKLTTPAEAVVREFIQNSLDARKDNETVMIKISFISSKIESIREFLDNNLKRHLIACNLLVDEYPRDVKCLILEDFGTTGLDGDFTPNAQSGNFYNFWWREGISEKRLQNAGRWGLGKTTFHIVSKIRTFWGLSVRNDRKTLLMGKTLLKTHTLDNERYHYFGYFSTNNFLPIEDDTIISSFKRNFGINRDNTEPGLSLVIPLPVDEINFDSLQKSVIQHYFYPILAGILKVEINDNDNHKHINLSDNNLIEESSTIDWSDTTWEGINIQEIFEFIKTAKEKKSFALQIINQDNPEITQESFGEQLDTIKDSFRSGMCIKFKVPVRIKKNDGSSQNTSFTIILKRFSDLRKPFEYYLRAGILISEIKTLRNRPIAALLIAEEDSICEFLGDCETPAHTNWNERTEGFAEKYSNAARILRFIKKSIGQILSIIEEPPSERQFDFLKEIFYIPVIPPIEKKPKIFNISPIQNGFSITLSSQQIPNLSFPFYATVKMAYDTFRGNPFNQYEEFDFDLGSNSININIQGGNIVNKELNKLEIQVTGNNFRLEVTGFDPNRDLVVDIKQSKGDKL